MSMSAGNLRRNRPPTPKPPKAALAQCRHDRDTLANRLEQAEAALAALQTPCMWVQAEGTYRDCHGGYWNPDDKGQFCPCCGHPIAVVEVAP